MGDAQGGRGLCGCVGNRVLECVCFPCPSFSVAVSAGLAALFCFALRPCTPRQAGPTQGRGERGQRGGTHRGGRGHIRAFDAFFLPFPPSPPPCPSCVFVVFALPLPVACCLFGSLRSAPLRGPTCPHMRRTDGHTWTNNARTTLGQRIAPLTVRLPEQCPSLQWPPKSCWSLKAPCSTRGQLNVDHRASSHALMEKKAASTQQN